MERKGRFLKKPTGFYLLEYCDKKKVYWWCKKYTPRNVPTRLGCVENRRFTSPRSYRSIQSLFVLL